MFKTVGHERAVRALKRAIEGGGPAHAYLLAGAPNVGKMTLALDIACAVNCVSDRTPDLLGDFEPKPCYACEPCDRAARGVHPDVEIISLEKNERGRTRTLIPIDRVRDAQRQAALKSREGGYRVFIFERADYLSGEAAVALLKTLEEPPQGVIFILLITDISRALPTIASRCQTIRLRRAPLQVVADHLVSNHAAESETAEEIARLSEGRIGWAVAAATEPGMLQAIEEKVAAVESIAQAGPDVRFEQAEKLARSFGQDRDSARAELAVWLEWWRDLMIVSAGLPRYVKHLARLDALQSGAQQVALAEIARAVSSVEETIRFLDRNANARLALENMMLSLPRIQ